MLFEILQNPDPFKSQTALQQAFLSSCIHNGNLQQSVKLNKPARIPSQEWVVEGSRYHVGTEVMKETGMLFSLVLACQLVLELDFSEGELHHCWYWQKCTQNPCKGIRKVCGLQRGEFAPSPPPWFLVLGVSSWPKIPLLCISAYEPQLICQYWANRLPSYTMSAHVSGIIFSASRLDTSKIFFKVGCQ